jgi:protease I
MTEDALDGKRVAFLAADGVELTTLTEPRRALEAAGARVDLVAPRRGEVWAMDHLERSGTVPVDFPLADAEPTRFDALVVPGGVANVDHLRRDPDAVAFVDGFIVAGTPVATIGHARGCSSRPTACAAARSPPGRRCRPTSRTPVASGPTSRSTSTGR